MSASRCRGAPRRFGMRARKTGGRWPGPTLLRVLAAPETAAWAARSASQPDSRRVEGRPIPVSDTALGVGTRDTMPELPDVLAPPRGPGRGSEGGEVGEWLGDRRGGAGDMDEGSVL